MYKKYKVAVPGKDVLVVNDENFVSLVEGCNKVHLIKFDFKNDNETTIESVKKVLENFPSTNRFIVDNYVRMYNSILRNIQGKKYYVQNHKDTKRFISFFRKNNKVVFSFPSLPEDLVDFFMDKVIFKDLLFNIEVIIMEEWQFKEMQYFMKEWEGNVIIHNKDYVI